MSRSLPSFSLLAVLLLLVQQASAWTPTHKVETNRGRIYLRPLSGGAVLFAFRPPDVAPLATVEDSPLWDPSFIAGQGGGAAAEELKLGEALELEGGSRVFSFIDPVSGRLTLELRYPDASGSSTRNLAIELSAQKAPFPRMLSIKAPSINHLYGLGEQFPQSYLGQTKTDWKGRIRHSGVSPNAFQEDPIGVYGNTMTPLAGGNVGNAHFPVLFMSDTRDTDALLFLDNPADTQWDFTRSPWAVKLRHGEIGGALAWGRELEELRAQYMEWTGRPPVPPRKAFGLWVSEYGYENWEEVESKASSLKDKGFPVDGFVLDLQWFGGITENSPDSQMGKLTFDLENFPNPAAKIAEFAQRGLGIILIEEAYIASGLEEFKDLAAREYLVRAPREKYEPQIINRVPWWGIGSMLDYTNPEVGKYWHETKRQPLIDLGILGHWTDLGEPEIFRHKLKEKKRGQDQYELPLYHQDKTQLEVNNIFGLSWARSIFEGYGKDGREAGPRPFILSRTGTSGIQRYGAALWSGDIGANWGSLRSHYVAQAHMAFSGIDYFGSDVGGFFREAFEGDSKAFDELYSRWFAAACLTDIPLRPHTMNLGNKYETSPDRVGHKASNLKNLRLRYRLIPYLYSAAHEAFLHGSPVVGPVAFEPNSSGEAALSGTSKRIGRDLLAELVLEPGNREMLCTLPAGVWYDFASGEKLSNGEQQSVKRPTVDEDGHWITPLFARAGAIINLGSPDSSSSQPDRLELVIFPGAQESSHRVYHDDGRTEKYRGGDYALTQVKQSAWRGDQYGQLTIEPITGKYREGLPARRDIVIHLASSRPRVLASVEGEQIEATRSGNFWTVTVPAVPLDQRRVISFQ